MKTYLEPIKCKFGQQGRIQSKYPSDKLFWSAVKFIERHSPADEETFRAESWGFAFNEPVRWCDENLSGRLGAAWRKIKDRSK